MTVWTHADQAEMDVLLWEMCDAYFDHLDGCSFCQARRRGEGMPCPYLGSAIAIVLDWRERRRLLTRAEELRLERRALLEAATPAPLPRQEVTA